MTADKHPVQLTDIEQLVLECIAALEEGWRPADNHPDQHGRDTGNG